MPADSPGDPGDTSVPKDQSASQDSPPPPSPGEGLAPSEEKPSPWKRLRRALIGAPRSLADESLFHKLSLIPFLAWVGLGADGLSSSAYGPEEAFRTLGEHTYLAIGLALVMASTISVIAIAYSRVIEHFPHGGGGYVVATQLLGEQAGVVSGSALLVDYILTITISIAAAGDAMFSFLPIAWHAWKLPAEVLMTAFLIVLNLRGVRESVLTLSPVFLLFIATHVILIMGGIIMHSSEFPKTLQTAKAGFSGGLATLGMGGMFLLFIHAYSLGGGTYTGIEAVSNGIQIMREPRVQTGKRTMLYMAVSLAFTASGLLFCYLLWNVTAVEGKTMNAVFAEKFVQTVPLGNLFVILTMASEGAILVVAAQAGFVDGPRVMANMAVDSWLPRRFASLSDRLTIQNGILLMGLMSLVALFYTMGEVRHLVVMYSINVFLTFSMTETSMCRFWVSHRERHPDWKRKISIHVIGLAMCLTILAVTVFEKFLEGGWVTLVVTGCVIFLCFLIRGHYRAVSIKIAKLPEEKAIGLPAAPSPAEEIDPNKPTAAVLISDYGKLGVKTVKNISEQFPGHFANMVFLTVGVVDSGAFKGGENALASLREQAEGTVKKYAALASRLGFSSGYRVGLGIDVVEAAERLCMNVAREFPHVTFFSGKLIFEREHWYHAFLHNQTAFTIERRLQWAGQTMVVLPIVVK